MKHLRFAPGAPGADSPGRSSHAAGLFNYRRLPVAVTLAMAALVLALGAGCQRSVAANSAPPAQPPEIPVVRAEVQSAPDALTFSGRIEAAQRVELRARVSGPITALHYQEGEIAAAGAALFEIDPRPYRARRDQCAAELARAQAALGLAQQELARARQLSDSRAISAEELERKTAETAAADAAREVARAALASAELDLEFTTVRAPVEGRVGRALLTVGNIATANASVLAVLVSHDPMRVRFAIDEPALHRLNASHGRAIEVKLGVSGSTREFSGSVDYVAPAVDPGTGTAEVRAELRVDGGVLRDGMFGRVQLLLPAEASHVLVPESAIGAEQGSRYVLVADADNKLVHRRVTLGSRQGAQRVITTGIEEGESVVIAGLQFLRPGMTIRPLVPAGKALAQSSR